MIESVTVTAGYAAKLPALEGKTITFKPGINVLFGPNGCGKSTLLRILAGYTFCAHGGWSSIVTKDRRLNFELGEHYWENQKVKPPPLPDNLRAAGDCQANVVWDGTSCYFNASPVSDAPIMAFGMTDMSDMEEIAEVMAKPSDGQKRLMRLNRAMKEINEVKPPDLTQSNIHHASAQECAKYVKGLPRNGLMTILFDEPDRSLSLENQVVFWACLPYAAKNRQVIVSTQSLLPIMKQHGEVNLIDLEAGYLAHSKKMVDLYLAGTPAADIVAMSHMLRESAAKADTKAEKPAKEKEQGEGGRKPRSAKQQPRRKSRAEANPTTTPPDDQVP